MTTSRLASRPRFFARTRSRRALAVAAAAAIMVPVGSVAAARADCGAGSMPETGLQGDVPAAERDSGRSSSGYSCNISRLGAYEGRGAGIVSASFDHCVYMGSFFPGNMLDQAQGVQVLDVTDHEGPRTGMIAGGDLSMPGMATMAELDALAASRGPDAEILFLQLMERHHRGGIAMAQAADRQLADGPVKQAAREMLQSQTQESGLMTVMLAQRNAAPLP
ncbi:DUF305 domain-containing protein [Rhodococcus sp. AG1013]|uniref:DUF305 domain-containing protein n=1 Tax=unclassified Rhodococcus (in: high G+C Gram-positive bacteria) TaxID=192944 RepID=UPI000E2A95F8|nr:DUF305 domain-containing protein [Rhodococcus sp. AG1013]RDI25695.1 DUF305 family protein family protein [Rhodococcus sp. AG1013]